MGLSLEEYAKQNPPTENEQREFKEASKPLEEERARTRAVEDLKVGILSQIRQGDEPQNILYVALEAIGILTNDREWEEACKGELGRIYEDLPEKAFGMVDATAALARMKEEHLAFVQKVTRQLNYHRRRYKKVMEELDLLEFYLSDIEGVTELEIVEDELPEEWKDKSGE